MEDKLYDVIVIGAGGMGSAAGFNCIRAGASTLIIEQFIRGHTQGSSHGNNRIIRFLYDKPFYIEMVKAAIVEWKKIEFASGKGLLFTTNGVSIGGPNSSELQHQFEAMEIAGIPSAWWSAQEFAQRYPQFRVDPDARILWQPDTGFIYADECNATYLESAERLRANVLEHAPVTEIHADGEHPEVVAGGRRFRARKLIVAAGPWTSQLLAELNLPLTVTRQQVAYFQPDNPDRYRIGQFPIFLDYTVSETIYGLPIFVRNGVKIARHGGGEATTPENVNRAPDPAYIDMLRNYLRQRIPGLAGECLAAQVCLYTETPDGDFIIDQHPAYPDVFLAAGFSGHGYKFASLVGLILRQLALDGRTEFNIQPFRLARFSPSN